MCEILQILTPFSIRTGEKIGTIGFKWLGLWEKKRLKIENYRLEFTLPSIRKGEEIGTIGFKWLGLWEEKRLKIENCRSKFGIKGFWNEIREIVEKYTGFSASPRWRSEERWDEWVSNEREGRKNHRLSVFVRSSNFDFGVFNRFSFSPCWHGLWMLLTWIPVGANSAQKKQSTQSAWNTYNFPY